MKILIVRVSSLGDVVHNMPMVADIMRHCPSAKIDWVVEEAYAPLIRQNDHVRTVIPFALRRWRKSLGAAQTRAEMRAFYQALRRESYDLIFDTQGLLKTSLVMRLARLARGGRRVGLANATEGSGYEAISRVFHTLSVPVGLRTPAVLRARLVAAAVLGYTIDRAPEFNLLVANEMAPDWMPVAPKPYAVFFHGTARDAKQWPLAHWLEIARDLAARKIPVLLPWGSEAERLTAEQMASQMELARVLPKLPLMEAIALAQHAVLVVGVDTGLTHVAAASNRPTIELYCDSPRWKTQGDWSPNIINLGDAGTPPAVADVQRAMTQLLGPVEREHSSATIHPPYSMSRE